MPSPAAQQMFNSLSPEEQARVTASLAGNPNGLDDWYQGAARAGDPRAFAAGGTGQSEDFRRFLDPGGEFNQQGQGAATLAGWAQQYYDEAASRAAGRPQFRSMRGAEGFFDKPTECPPGMGPGGPNESDPCVPYGGPQTAPQPAPQAAPTATPQTAAGNPFAGLLGAQGGTQPTDWTRTGGRTQPPTLPQYGGINPGANTSSLASVLTPLQGQQAPSPLTSTLAPIMGQQQRRKSPLASTLTNNQSGRWF